MPIVGGVVALVVVLALVYLFVGPRRGVDIPPVIQDTPLVEEAPPPAIDVGALERAANQALAGLPCAALSARVSPDGSAAVSGTVSQPGDVNRVATTLAGIEGLGATDASRGVVESRPVCSAAALVGGAARAGAVSVWTTHPDGVFRDGDYLVGHASVPGGPPVHLYVDYVDPGGDVVHLKPSPFVPDSMVDGGSEVQLGAEAADTSPGARYSQLGAPYGRAVVIALASAAPLFASPREEVEPAATYLAALDQALAAQGGEVQGGWQYLEIVGE
jgi:hypothetical protein